MKKKKKNKPIWPRFSHNPNTKQNSILKIKLNQNKQIWKKEKKNADLIQPGGGEEDEQRWGGGRGSAAWWMLISTGFVLLATSISTGGESVNEQQSFSSLSLSLYLCLSLFFDEKSKWCCWKVLEEKKK